MIRRRTALAILLSVLVSLPLPSWAQGNGNGQNNGNANSQNNGNSNSQNNGNAHGHENGNNGNNGNGNNGNGHPNGNANEISVSLPDAPNVSSPGAATPAIAPSSSSAASQPATSPPGQNEPPLSQDDVLAAVESGRAVPLESLLADVRSRTGGDVIEANLQRVRGFLIYSVTVLTPAGRVSTEYYYARSGLHIGQP